MTGMGQLPLIIFDGNCQGQHLSAIISATNIAECYSIGQDLGFLPSHLGYACQYVSEEDAYEMIIDAKRRDRFIIQATQSTPQSDGAEMSYTHLVDKIIRYPHLQFYAVSPREAQEQFGARATPTRMLNMDLDIIGICQRRANARFDFASFIRETSQNRSLFHTALHPNGEVMAHMLRSFSEQIPDADISKIECAAKFLEKNEGINSSTLHPVGKDILVELGFDWGEGYEVYREMMELRVAGEWQAIVDAEERYLEKFASDSWCWLSLTQAYTALGDWDRAQRCLWRLLELSPGNLHFWLCGLNIFLASGDSDGVQALAHRANAFFRGQRIFSQVMAYFHLNSGRADKAVAYARDYHQRTPDRADALVPLLQSLKFLQREEDVKQIIEFEVAHANPSRLAEIRANLSALPEFMQYMPN